MNRLLTLTTAAAAAIALGAFGTAASSATIIKAVQGGAVSGSNPFVALPVLALLKTSTYDFTFNVADPLAGSTSTQLQAQVSTGQGIPEPISFSLYSGTTGSGTYIATSAVSTSSILSEDLTAGSYYIQITPSEILVNKEVDSGSIVTAPVPEPAVWAMMLMGFAGLGLVVRRKGAKSASPV